MGYAKDILDEQPPWSLVAHATLLISLTITCALVFYAPTAVYWAAWAVLAAFASSYLQWKIGRVDASRLRGHTLISGQRLLAVVSLLCALSTLNPVFASVFVALPLATARLPFPGTQRVWVTLSALSSLSLLGAGLPPLTVWAIVLTALVCTVFALRTAPQRILTAYMPEDAHRRRPQLTLDTHLERLEACGEDATTDNLHHLVTVARASARARFAGIFWLDPSHEKMTAAIVETSLQVGVFERPLPLSVAFPECDTLASASQQIQHSGTPAWYLEDTLPDAQLMVVQIVDDGIALGLLILDRAASHGPYQQADLLVAEHCAMLIAQQLRQERVALAAARTSHDLRLVARAAEVLSDTLSENEVYRIGAELFQELLLEAEVAFFRIAEDEAVEVSYVSDGWKGLMPGQRLSSTPNLVSLAIQRRHVLPYRPEGESDDPPLFGGKLDKGALDTHLVCPLVSGREAHSAVVIRVPYSGQFRPTVRERLQLVSNQLAAALGIARAYETMVERATTDGMTQLLNHMTFRDQSQLAVERAQRSKRPLSVLLLDIDHFKQVNDTYGHAVGDSVIQAVAGAIRAQVRRVDIAARYGGEEFAIVLEDTGEEGALLFAERLRAAVEGLTHRSSEVAFGVTISIGVAVYPEHAPDAEQLTENADAALYVSKQSGRNRVSVWSNRPSLQEQVA